MAGLKNIKGFDKVKRNLNKEIMAIQGRSMQGLIEAAIFIRRDMEETPPLIPIDTGNLRASWFTSPIREGAKFGLMIGFSANYAVFVHENMEATFSRPGAGPKFLEAALSRNKEEILTIIGNNTRTKG